MTVIALVLNGNGGFAVLLRNLERPVPHITDDIGIVHLTTDETFGVKDSVGGVGVESVLGRVTDTKMENELRNSKYRSSRVLTVVRHR